MTENIKTTMDITEIKSLIPHRFPMLLVDKVNYLNTEKGKIVAIKNVTSNEEFFNGHFPTRPIMPGVLIVEAMAQSSCLLIMRMKGYDSCENKSVNFMSIDEAKFRKPVIPGDVMEIHSKIIKARGKIWKLSGEVLVDGARVANAQYTAMIHHEVKK